jgi:GNAT superfamily N-acetyltransferase
MTSALDNPIWSALTTADIDKNIGTKDFAFLDADIAPFIAMSSWDELSQKKLLAHAPENRSWFLLIAEEVSFIEGFELVSTIPLYQLTCLKLITVQNEATDLEIVPLSTINIDEMVALTELTKPGPFRTRTIEFGNYHGIFKDGKLAAMGGERLHLDGYTEVSAICTHPNYQGKGYAAKITSFLTASVIAKGQTAFLHARTDNTKALDVYKRLGYEIRSIIQFYIIKRK